MLFETRCLHYDKYLDEQRNIDIHKLSPATSPELTTIVVSLTLTTAKDHVHISNETNTLTSTSPYSNALPRTDLDGTASSRTITVKRKKYEELNLNLPGSLHLISRIQLDSLGINCTNNTAFLRTLHSHIHFSHLRTLQLWRVSEAVLRMAVAEECQFSYLTSLVFDPYFTEHEERQIHGEGAA
ncbi:hypothetical protein BDW74DRAFT_180838 [Aspergillus multicolor]|uniref:uncharacterized protein n=1 Tax=Aspergillus multicolor TaxID=41759 RepID=UPI003CCD88F6